MKVLKKVGVKEATNLKEGLLIGISSGIIVLVVDRTVSILFNNFVPMQFNSVETMTMPLINNLIQIAIATGVIFFAITVVIYKTVEKYDRKK